MTLEEIKDIIDIVQYQEACKEHDWTYGNSDSHEVYQKGKAAENALVFLAELKGDAWKAVYNMEYAKAWGKNVPSFRYPFPDVAVPDEHPPFVTIYQPIGGWNAVIMTWDEDALCYMPWQTGFNNTLGTKSRAGAIGEAKHWAETEEIEYRGPNE